MLIVEHELSAVPGSEWAGAAQPLVHGIGASSFFDS